MLFRSAECIIKSFNATGREKKAERLEERMAYMRKVSGLINGASDDVVSSMLLKYRPLFQGFLDEGGFE